MFYRIKDKYLFRGWNKSPNGVVDSETGNTAFINGADYFLLRTCNGIVQLDGILFNDKMRKRAEEMTKAGYLESSETPLPMLTEKQKYKAYDNRFINSVHWSITGKCNYRCKHCYMEAPRGQLHEFSFEECKKIIDDLAACGIRKVSLTGGEALVHPRFWDIVDVLIEKEIVLECVYSNGFLIDETFFKKCEERNIKTAVSLSFDGLHGGHEWIRNVPGALEHVTRALELCKEHGFPVNVEYCMYKGNKDDLFDSVAFLEEHGCTAVKVNALTVTGEASALHDQAFTMREQYDVMLDILKQYKKHPFKMRMMLFGVIVQNGNCIEYRCTNLTDETAKKCHLCEHAHYNIYISPEGKVLPCIPIDENQGLKELFPSILELPLKQILNDSFFSQALGYSLDDYHNANPECEACEHKYKCGGGCRGWAVPSVSEPNYLAKDPNTCYYHKNHIYDQVRDLFPEPEKKKENKNNTAAQSINESIVLPGVKNEDM